EGSKWVDREHLAAECRRRQRIGQKVVFTNGCFDILHVGHARLLREAAKLGDYLVVGLNSDASVRRLKGDDRPINAQQDRVELLAALESVDAVTVFDEDTPLSLIEALQPDVLVKGGDYLPDEVVGREVVEARGGRLALIPLAQGHSTTGVVRRISGRGLSPHGAESVPPAPRASGPREDATRPLAESAPS